MKIKHNKKMHLFKTKLNKKMINSIQLIKIVKKTINYRRKILQPVLN